MTNNITAEWQKAYASRGLWPSSVVEWLESVDALAGHAGEAADAERDCRDHSRCFALLAVIDQVRSDMAKLAGLPKGERNDIEYNLSGATEAAEKAISPACSKSSTQWRRS